MSISFGLWSTLIAYIVSIPLGIRKVVNDATTFDTWTSALIIVAYAIPVFLIAILLRVLFAGGSYWQIFPLYGHVFCNAILVVVSGYPAVPEVIDMPFNFVRSNVSLRYGLCEGPLARDYPVLFGTLFTGEQDGFCPDMGPGIHLRSDESAFWLLTQVPESGRSEPKAALSANKHSPHRKTRALQYPRL